MKKKLLEKGLPKKYLQAYEYELTEEDKKELDRRMNLDKKGKEKGFTWEEAKERVRAEWNKSKK